ncbi:MAG: trypsin-like peptidase domain-containing protein [Oscillospiraceae bacterium]|nr:trypsin-like peptidase domain-containing protein [Oscillospiraceae bacterium]
MDNTNEKKDELLELFSKISEEKSGEVMSSEDNSEDISEKITNFENDIFRDIEENSEKKKKKRKSGRLDKILLIVFSALMLLSVVGLSIYCIITDIAGVNLNSVNGTRKQQFTLNVLDKPPVEQAYMDENGKYTVEGIAAVISPKIVEIYIYEKKNSEIISKSGSGIIVSHDGYIVTNTHVLDGAEKYVVKTHDGATYNAELKGRDAKTDIAVVRIDANGLIPAQFGDSNQVVQGESVVCAGNPEGLTGSITEGIVSGLNRKIKTEQTGFEMNCIQTDAAISPGNSGGALVNMYGQVIGITSSKYAATTSEGLGFAIAINDAKPIIEELINQGYVSGRVRIGITFYSAYANYMNVMFKEEFGFDIPKELENSLWIEEISNDCDISNTELKPKDFILSIDGKKVGDYESLESVIKGKSGGDKVTAKCARVSDKGEISYFDIEFKLMADRSGDF